MTLLLDLDIPPYSHTDRALHHIERAVEAIEAAPEPFTASQVTALCAQRLPGFGRVSPSLVGVVIRQMYRCGLLIKTSGAGRRPHLYVRRPSHACRCSCHQICDAVRFQGRAA
jgi:hypothetical protein